MNAQLRRLPKEAELNDWKECAYSLRAQLDNRVAREHVMLSALKSALKTVLDEAEARNYEPPANCELVAELEYAIAKAEGRS